MNLLSLATQVFLTGQVLKRFGTGVAAGALPGVYVVGFAALSACAAPRVERFVRQTLESGVICFFIGLGRLRGGLVRLLLMLLPPATRPTTACCLGIASLCQQRGRHYCDDEFCN